jgi:cardiolipin synthase
MVSRALAPANQITILRLVFVPLFAILVVGRHYGWALVVLVFAGLSDILDGTVARVFKQETPLGVALDPIADKVLMTTAYLVLAFRGALPWWLTILVISRDVAILMTALLISLVAGYRPFYPTFLGKVSTAVQEATIFAACGFEAHIPFITKLSVQVCVYLAAALTLTSGVHYLVVCRHRYSQHSSEQDSASSPSGKGVPSERSEAALPSKNSGSL